MSKEKAPDNYRWRMLALLALLTALGLIILSSIPYLSSYLNAVNQQEIVAEIVNQYMSAMENGDIETAYSLFATNAQTSTLKQQLNEMATGPDQAVFQGYETLQIQQFSVNVGQYQNPNPDAPKGTVGQATGRILYEDNLVGEFEATLEKVNGKWMLFGIRINAPLEKLNPNT